MLSCCDMHHNSRDSAMIFNFADVSDDFESAEIGRELDGNDSFGRRALERAGARSRRQTLTIDKTVKYGISPYSFLVLERIQSPREAE